MSDFEMIFKAYDIRGRTDTGDLDAEGARRIGAAFASFVSADRIAVGRDCRASSPSIAGAFIEGITGQGVDVLDLGEVATDTVYYVSGREEVPGAMITASHNPPEYNGIKLCRAGAAPVGHDTGLQDIRAMAEGELPVAETPGSAADFDGLSGYIEHLFSIVNGPAIGNLKVAVDGGNGMAGVVLPAVFARISADLVPLYLEPDGTFPNHPADPLNPDNLVDLIALMETEGADLGVAFDGDADRAFFIDDQRRPLSGSTTTALIAKWFLAREPGATIVHNLITSRAVPEVVIAAGGKPIRTRVGHSFIKQIMAETGAIFGGEHSGHYYFRDNYRADSGMLAMLVLLQVLSESGQSLSQLRTEVEPYAASGEINLSVADQNAALVTVERKFADGEIDKTDGLTVSWSDRWFNLRPSNTEPVLRLNVEGADAAMVDRMVSEVRTVIEGSPSPAGLIAPELKAILVCPKCHGDLREDVGASKLECLDCGLRYPVEDGIPVMLIDEAEQPR
ncbi:MAG: phosphomannomutase/phosphoglucomutase [Acidimicrobiia bacterium]|nr:phosphomannomutase/phosphoglucomutase [Acidimicrobiia bacterium]